MPGSMFSIWLSAKHWFTVIWGGYCQDFLPILELLSSQQEIYGGCMVSSFDVGIADSNSPDQPYSLLLPTTHLHNASLMLTCMYWFMNHDWRPRSESLVLFPGRCIYCIVLFLNYRLSIDLQHIDKNTKMPAWMCPSPSMFSRPGN